MTLILEVGNLTWPIDVGAVLYLFMTAKGLTCKLMRETVRTI